MKKVFHTSLPLFVDFDNTLIVNEYDVDLTGDLDLFFEKMPTLSTRMVNIPLHTQLLAEKFTIFTNRGEESKKKIFEHLEELRMVNNLTGMILCAGKKMDYLSAMTHDGTRKSVYFIDNAIKYNPDLLVEGNVLTHRPYAKFGTGKITGANVG